MAKISPATALRVLEVFVNRMGTKLEKTDRLESLNEMVEAVNFAFIGLIDAAENAPQIVPDKLMELSAICAIAVASMVAGDDTQKEIVRDALQETLPEMSEAERHAFTLMQERFAKLREKAGSFLS